MKWKLLVAFLGLNLISSYVFSNVDSFDYIKKSCQSIEKYLKIEIPKLSAEKVDLLVRELESYQYKIEHVSFDYTTRILTVHYFTISMDDILQIVSKYTSDFNKIEGTEMQ